MTIWQSDFIFFYFLGIKTGKPIHGHPCVHTTCVSVRVYDLTLCIDICIFICLFFFIDAFKQNYL